jgi:hypothetical protein
VTLLAFGVRVEDGVAWGPSGFLFGGMASVGSCSHAALKGRDAAVLNMIVQFGCRPSMNFMPRLIPCRVILPFKALGGQ